MSSGGTGLNREQLRWLLSLSLSHAIKNARRDFSNGYLVAEILHCYYPQDVPLHSFDDKASSEKRKRDNWALLQKLFRRKGLRVSPDLVDGVLACRSGCIVPLLEKIHKHVTAPVPAAPAAPARMASPPRLARPAPSTIAPPEQYDVTSSPYSQGEMHASPEFVRYGSRGGFEMEARLMPAQRHQPNYGESHYDDINGSMRAPQMAGAIPAFHLNPRAAPAAPAPFHDGYAHQGGGWTGAGGGLSPPAFHVQADPSDSYGMVHPTHSSVLAPPQSYGSGGADWGGGGGHPHAAPMAHDWMREGVVPPAFSSQVHDERRRPPPAYLVRPFAGNGPSVNAPYGQDPPAGYGQGAHEGAPHKAAFGVGKMESRDGGGGYANYGKENHSRPSYSDAHVQEQLERASQSAQSARNDAQYAGYGDKKRDAKYWTLGKLGADLDAKDLVDKRSNRERMKQFSSEIRRNNAKVVRQQKHTDDVARSQGGDADVAKKNSARQRALEFARNIPKPAMATEKVAAVKAPDAPAPKSQTPKEKSERPPSEKGGLSELDRMLLQHDQDSQHILDLQRKLKM